MFEFLGVVLRLELFGVLKGVIGFTDCCWYEVAGEVNQLVVDKKDR